MKFKSVMICFVLSLLLTIQFSGCNSGSSSEISLGTNLSFSVRRAMWGQQSGVYTTEMDNYFYEEEVNRSVSKVAIVLMDVWDDCENEGWAKRCEQNIQDRVVPLLEFAREAGILVIHIPHGYYEMSYLIVPRPGEPVLTDENSQALLISILNDNGIKVILYAGYAANKCILFRPEGMIEMHDLGWETYLLRDCSIAVETRETLATESCYHAALNIIDSTFGSVDSDSLAYW